MFDMTNSRSKYLVQAELVGTGAFPEDFDDAKAGRPIERRLNRIERVVAAYRGQIDKRVNNGLQMAFDSADASLLAACEMHHRCSLLPQLSGNRLALRIGIHRGLIRQRAKDSSENAREIAEILAVADNNTVISRNALDDLNCELKKLARPLKDPVLGIEAYTVDWQEEIPSAAYGGESFWPASKSSLPMGACLLLHYGLKTVELSLDNPTLTVGRDPSCDLVLTEDHVSRHHCRIESRADHVILTDSSTNGTCIKPDEGVELLVRNDSVTLKGKGLLFFGRPFKGERRGGVRYVAI